MSDEQFLVAYLFSRNYCSYRDVHLSRKIALQIQFGCGFHPYLGGQIYHTGINERTTYFRLDTYPSLLALNLSSKVIVAHFIETEDKVSLGCHLLSVSLQPQLYSCIHIRTCWRGVGVWAFIGAPYPLYAPRPQDEVPRPSYSTYQSIDLIVPYITSALQPHWCRPVSHLEKQAAYCSQRVA